MQNIAACRGLIGAAVNHFEAQKWIAYLILVTDRTVPVTCKQPIRGQNSCSD